MGIGGILGGGQQLLSRGMQGKAQATAQDMPSVTPEILSKGMQNAIREQAAPSMPAKTFIPRSARHKAERINNHVTAGMSRDRANAFYTLVHKKR